MTNDQAPPATRHAPTAGLHRNFLYAAASSGSAALLLAVLMLAGRTLGTEAFGQFSWVVSLATIGEALMDWGLHQVAIRSVAREHASANDCDEHRQDQDDAAHTQRVQQ